MMLGLTALALKFMNRAEALEHPTRVQARILEYNDYGEPITRDIDVTVTTKSELEAIEQSALEAARYWGDAPYLLTDVDSDFAPALEGEYIPSSDGDIASAERNMEAFLALIRRIESNDDYFALVYGGQFNDTSDHPANLGWPGMARPDDGRLTTAAGAYQITRTTWNDIRQGLPDFSPQSQDLAAIKLLHRRRAFDDVVNGNTADAIRKLKNEWEAFRKYDSASLIAMYRSLGGNYA